ncbi:hypothetical protein KIW84_057393 [Lathyrus oleraceus]|uniref:Phytocyanin domain-containing protein n=1 Tax=Pisum sativum TaxID=3888 RepID=A0A9D5ANT1_PEA|nr:hypothetical protein KIW84_057393 [Pisum sativum]
MGAFQIIVRVSFMAMLIKLAMATNHIVGGPNGGWDTSSDLQSWASSKQFSIGDNLVFQYQQNHDVVEVTKADYDSCQQTNAIQSYNDGATTIPLTSQGKRYFICGTIGHCSQGMKVEIDTLATQISPVSPAVASPPIADSPIISIIPSAAPKETTTSSPAESPESPRCIGFIDRERKFTSLHFNGVEFCGSVYDLLLRMREISLNSTISSEPICVKICF